MSAQSAPVPNLQYSEQCAALQHYLPGYRYVHISSPLHRLPTVPKLIDSIKVTFLTMMNTLKTRYTA